MVDMWPVAIPQLSGKKTRRVYVYLPEAAGEDPDMRFPVMYMFDGHNVFFDDHATYGKSWGMRDFMDESGLPLIIVAVECNHGRNYARLKEYAPFTFTDECFGRIVGKGKTYMDWLVDTLKPMIDAAYPTLTDREHTFIAGSSMGGLMSLYAAAAYNHVFCGAACLSPSVWAATKRLRRCIRESEIAPDTVVYMDYGSGELSNHPGMLGCYASVQQELMQKGVMLTSRIIPGGTHCEASWEKQIPWFMHTLLGRYE